MHFQGLGGLQPHAGIPRSVNSTGAKAAGKEGRVHSTQVSKEQGRKSHWVHAAFALKRLFGPRHHSKCTVWGGGGERGGTFTDSRHLVNAETGKLKVPHLE